MKSDKNSVVLNSRIIFQKENLDSLYKSRYYANLALSRCKRILPLRLSEKLVRVVGCLLTDGFMDIRKRGDSTYYGYIGFFSKNQEELRDFDNLFFDVFGVRGTIRDWGRRAFGKSQGCIILNSIATRILSAIGVPGGDKIKQEYAVPGWIMESDITIKSAFLKQLFDCEGSISFSRNSNRWEIKYAMYKSKYLLDSCIRFLKDLQKILSLFDIHSTIQKQEEYFRKKDGLNVIGLNLRISKKYSVLNYSKHIGFGLIRKKKRLDNAVKYYKNK